MFIIGDSVIANFSKTQPQFTQLNKHSFVFFFFRFSIFTQIHTKLQNQQVLCFINFYMQLNVVYGPNLKQHCGRNPSKALTFVFNGADENNSSLDIMLVLKKLSETADQINS